MRFVLYWKKNDAGWCMSCAYSTTNLMRIFYAISFYLIILRVVCFDVTCICLGLIIQVPRESLLFVIPAFGGTVSWEGKGAPFGESDDSITHQVCD